MTSLETLQSELNTVRKALQYLGDYQSAFDYGEQTEEEWDSLQKTMRELYVMKMVAETKINLRKDKEETK